MTSFLHFFLLLGIAHFVTAQSSINAAFKKPVSANITCGSPEEEFYTTLDKDKRPDTRIAKTCDANDPKNAHPPSYLVDESLATFWQSTARKTAEQRKAYIQIDLQQKFFAREIKLSFGLQRRPKAIKISRSDAVGAPFQPYHYLVERPVETASTCQDNFGVDVHARGVIIERVDKVLCQYYEKNYPDDYNETITVDLTRRSRGVQNAEYTSEVLAWLSVASLRFKFLDMNTVLGQFAYKFHHYSVREIEFFARCDCKGHGDGSNCPQNETTKRRSCVCKNNTCGENCETCCPLYNQKSWSAGSKAPWEVDTSFSCERCNCHNHADMCVYNQTVNDLKLSLDIHGNRSGGGVCQDCKNHTRGINCEKCKEFYYRPRGRDHKREDACEACKCDVKGTKNVSSLAFLDCVPDETELSQHSGKEPGDCYCKANVRGSKCNQCKPEFFNLAKENPEGCMGCNCHRPGTVNATNVCNTRSTGQCPCKKNVELRDCSQCKHGYYNMRNESADGCQNCGCDEGGTYPENTCDKVTGQCQCRPNIINRVCDKPKNGFFYPEVHHFSASKDPYKNATNTLSVCLPIPKTSKYHIIIKTTNNEIVGAADIDSMETNSSTITGTVLMSCFGIGSGYCNISTETYCINVTVKGVKKLVQIVALPKAFIEATVLGTDRIGAFKFQCDITRNDMSSNEKLCKEGVFSLTAAFLNGTLPCACNIDGSFNHTTCQEYGGQCSCKTGVEGRDCSRCKPGYYNLTAEGCQPCSCKGPNRVCHPQTGMCECPANTIGRTCEPCQCNGNSNKCSRNGDCSDCQHNTTGMRCERCVNMTYGDALTQQCRACDCNSTGSVGSYCDIVTGQCICKSKVSGRACDTCQNNTFDFGSSGCKDCGCNIYGSASQQCNVSGHCQCKTGAGGMKCSKCTTGYYGLPAKACQACNCNATGTINGTVCNSDAIGQCQCKQGVTGRTCDRCDKYFSNFTDQGCSACPACVMELTKLVNKIAAQANVTTDKGELLEKLARFHAPLADAELLEGRSTMKFDAFLERLKVAGVTYENLIMTNLPHLNVSYNKVYDENAGVMQSATSVSREVASELNRTKDIHMRTKEAESDIKELDSLLKNIMATFAAQVQYGQQAIRSANESVTDHMMRDFSSQQAIVDMNTRDADNLTSFVAMFAKQVLNQTSLASRLNSEIQQNRRNLSQLVNEWTATHDNFLDLIAQIQHQFSGVRDVIKDTQMVLAKEALRLQEAKNVGNDSDHILNTTKNDLKLALEKLESYKATVTAVSGEIQISMLKYKDEGNWFALKVLAARNLSPRDLPSGSADPYVLISFIPNEHGTKRSTTKKGTLNPKWGSFEQIFEFNITHEQLKKSKLKVRVLDEDPEDADDFMGEAIIDLSVVGDAEFTKWYPLSSADVSTLESGDFKATSGLADASSLLQSQKNKMMAILGTVDIRLRLAHQNAQLMKNQAEAMQREFRTVQGHGETAVQAIHQFNEIERVINNSIDTLSRANNIIASLALQMNRMPASALIDMARQAKTLASNFLNDVIKRNLSENGVAHVEEYLTRLNDSLKDIIPIWAQTYVHYPDLIKAGNRLKLAAEDAPSAYNAIKSAQEKCRAYEQFVAQAANEVNGIEREVNSLQEKIAFIQSSSQRDMSLIQDAYLHVNNASENMNKSQASVQEVTRIDQVISAQRENISSTLNNVEKRLNDLKRRLSQLDIGLKIDGMGTATYRFPFEWTKSHSEISVIVRTNSSEGQLLNMSSSTTSSQRSQVFTTLSLKNGFVRATFNVGKGDINLINTLRVNDGQWHQIDFTRHGSMGTLTIESPTQWRTVTHNSNDLESTMQFQQGDVVVVGQGNSNPYEVVFSNLKIDQYPILFWDYQSISGTVGVAQPRYPNIYLPDNGLAATFDSARIWSQDIELLSNYLEVEFSFRTFEENGVLMSTFYNDVAELLLYLKNGYLFVEMKNGSDVDVIQSKRSNYNSGIWYGLAFVHDENGNLLNITQSNAVVDTITNTTALTGNRLHATDITIGSISPNISMNGLKETATFIGDMKDFKLSTERAKSLQQVSFKQSSHIDGVYTNEVIAGNVEPGAARFYGFTKGTNKCSYVSVNNTKSSATSLSFMFKTLKKNELLLYSKTMIRNKTVILYIALWHGNLQILNHESNGSNEEAKPYMTSGISFADNIWREVYINSSAKGYSLYVNNSLIYSGWFGNGRQIPFDLSNPLYMGGLPPNVTIPLKPVVTNCFQGAMKNVKIDDMDINLFSQDKENVINGGVLPGRSPPPPPPTCAAPAGPIAYSTDKSTVGFVSGFTGESQGYLQISNGVQLEDYFLWTLRLRPLSYNGLVFYIANNLTHPGQFMSLELIDGKLKFQVNGNPGMVHMATKFDYVNTQRSSSFLTISGLYVSKGKFGAMLIYETQEYHNYQIKNATNGEILNLTGAFFFGGVPNGVKLHPRVTQRSGFSGCIHSFQYHSSGSSPRTIDLSKPSVSHKTQSCVSNAVAGFGLNSTSWVKFGNVSLNTSTMDIQMEFRTSSRQGVVFHLTNNNARQGHQSYLRLEQINGQLVMTYKNASAFTRKVTWSASSSYFLCNMTWHTVQVKGAGNKLQLTVDQSSSVTLTVAMDAKLMGDLYVGGMPASISSPPTGFTGCIKGIKISNKILDYGRATSGMHVTNGCASTGTAQKSNDALAR